MTGLRRGLLAFYSLLLMAACGGLITLAWVGSDVATPLDGDKLDIQIGDFNLQAFVISDDVGRVVFTIVMGLIASFGLITVLLAFTKDPVSKSSGTLKLRQADGGYVEVPASTIESILRQELEQQPTIQHANVHVNVAGGEVDSFLTIGIAQDANIAQATNEATTTVARALQEQVGVTKVRRPSVKIVYEDGAVAKPSPVPAPPPPPPYVAPASPAPTAPEAAIGAQTAVIGGAAAAGAAAVAADNVPDAPSEDAVITDTPDGATTIVEPTADGTDTPPAPNEEASSPDA